MKKLMWIGTLTMLILAACNGGALESNQNPEVAEPEVEEATVDVADGTDSSDADEESVEAEVDEESSSTGASSDSGSSSTGAEIITGGEMPARLAMTAARWETDWSRRTVDFDDIISGGVPRDAIRSVDNPDYMTYEEANDWVVDTEPVVGVVVEGHARAFPLSLLTRHEIANTEIGGVPIAATFCPLCNAAVVFDRRVDGEVYEFGVSGLLRNSDLIMYDRTTESLWQQFTGQGIVGTHAGDQLQIIPSTVTSYADFKEAYPDGLVIDNNGREYGYNPYSFYDETEGRPFLYIGEIDGRLPVMMRIVGVDYGDEFTAYPYSYLADNSVVNDSVGGQDLVIFYEFGTNSALGASDIASARDVGAATVFDPNVDGQTLTFELSNDGFVDQETGSTWNLLGQAVAGPLEGTSLTVLDYSNDFWFAWAAFHPDTVIFGAE